MAGRHFDDLTGRVIGIYKVIKFSHMAHNGKDGTHGMSYYVCECNKCGKRFIIARSRLTNEKCITHKGKCIKHKGKYI